MLLDKVKAELYYILSGGDENFLKTVLSVNEYFLGLMIPKNMDGGKENVVIIFNVQFSELCVALMAKGIPDPETMTVFRFYTAMKYFEEKQKPQIPT